MPEVHILVPSYEGSKLGLLGDLLLRIRGTAFYPYRLTLVEDVDVPPEDLPKKFNRMIRQALRDPECKFIVLHANDVLPVTYGWLKLMIEKMKSDPKIGTLLPIFMVNYGYGYGQFYPDPDTGASGQFISENSESWDSVDVNYDDFSHAMCITRREVFEQEGLLDENFGPGSFQHADMAYRMIAGGWQVRMWGKVKVQHDPDANPWIWKKVYPTEGARKKWDDYFILKWGFLPGKYRADELYKYQLTPRFEGEIW